LGEVWGLGSEGEAVNIGKRRGVMSVEMLEGLVIILMKTNYQVKYELGVIYKEKLTNKV
jgi:hypothetical protein